MLYVLAGWGMRRCEPAGNRGSRGSATLVEGWNEVYDYHWLDGEEPARAVARAERWAERDLRGAHYDVGCDRRLSDDVRERLAQLLAIERDAPR